MQQVTVNAARWSQDSEGAWLALRVKSPQAAMAVCDALKPRSTPPPSRAKGGAWMPTGMRGRCWTSWRRTTALRERGYTGRRYRASAA